MSQVIADKRDIDFVLYEQLCIEEILKNKRYNGLNKKTADMIVSEARNISINEILPTLTEGDRTGLVFENGNVKVPESYKRVYQLLKEGDW